MSPERIAKAYEAACRAEIEALKPGNVHVFADGHRMTAAAFLDSARASAPALVRRGSPVGERILGAVEATRSAVGTNTNLGIVLLAAPLAAAAEGSGPLRQALSEVLAGLSVADARSAFEAIVLAEPAGLGEAAAHDVREAPAVTLLEAMRAASDRDLIARQYATVYAEVFDLGLPALASGEAGMWPTVACYMAFLTTLPDSHVARKHGLPAALDLRDEAAALEARLAGSDEAARRGALLAFDASLKARGINPGTSADLTVACLLVHNLLPNLHKPGVGA